MPLNEAQISKVRDQITACKKAVVFFDDDPDGLTSYLQLAKKLEDVHGFPVKTKPLNASLFKKADEYAPDRIFILDVPQVDPASLAELKVPVTWIDHHEAPEEIPAHVTYCNPLLNQPPAEEPIAYQIHLITESSPWLSMIGCVGDWFIPPFAAEFSKQHPDLFPASIQHPADALFTTKIGELSRGFSFLLKGDMKIVKKCISYLRKIKNPEEILAGSSAAARFLNKKIEKTTTEYNELLEIALQKVSDDPILLFQYDGLHTSFTSELSNELLYRFPKKVILIGRRKGGSMKCSLRASFPLLEPLKKSLATFHATGGGHPNACGCSVKEEDFEQFLDMFKKELLLSQEDGIVE